MVNCTTFASASFSHIDAENEEDPLETLRKWLNPSWQAGNVTYNIALEVLEALQAFQKTEEQNRKKMA